MLKRDKIKRLKELGMSVRAIAKSLNYSRKTVRKYLSVAPNEIDRGSRLQFFESPIWIGSLDWKSLHEEHVKGVSLNVLWEEGRESGLIPVEYPGFWKQYNRKFPNLPKSRVEIEYCTGIKIFCLSTGKAVKTHFFAGCLCYSRYLYDEFTFSQKSEDFLNSHVRMFEYFGGVPATITPDNLKSAVSKAHRYDPDINPAYVQLMRYFGVTVTPVRARRPTDKPIVERTIQTFQK